MVITRKKESIQVLVPRKIIVFLRFFLNIYKQTTLGTFSTSMGLSTAFYMNFSSVLVCGDPILIMSNLILQTI